MTMLSLLYFVRDESVPKSQWSYPQTPGIFLATSAALAIAHALSACGYVGVRRSSLSPRGVGRVGLIAAALASLGLSTCELLSGVIGRQDSTSTVATTVSTMFGVVSLLFAASTIVAGVVLVRHHNRPLGWLMLLTGVVIIVLVTPANISGNLAFRQLSLLVWSLLFIPLGLRIAKLRA